MESDTPAWLEELAENDSSTPAKTESESIESSPSPPAPQDDESGVNLMPDWLSDLSADEPAQAEPEPVPDSKPELPPEGSSEIPDWLGDFDPSADPESGDDSGQDWLDSLAGKGILPKEDEHITTAQKEIVESERNYLNKKQTHPFSTDVRYFFSAMYNILIKRARSQ